MSKFIVRWNAGYGDNYEVVEAVHEHDASMEAYHLWHEDVESSADYEVIGEATEELCEEYDVEMN